MIYNCVIILHVKIYGKLVKMLSYANMYTQDKFYSLVLNGKLK